MKASEQQREQQRGPHRGAAPWTTGAPPSLFDVSIARIPGVGVVYQSLLEWQAECEPRVYPQRDFDKKEYRQ